MYYVENNAPGGAKRTLIQDLKNIPSKIFHDILNNERIVHY